MRGSSRRCFLRHDPDSARLPAMFVLALVPPLWRRIIDPRVRAFRAGVPR